MSLEDQVRRQLEAEASQLACDSDDVDAAMSGNTVNTDDYGKKLRSSPKSVRRMTRRWVKRRAREIRRDVRQGKPFSTGG